MFDADTPVTEIMSRDLVLLRKGQTLAEALKTLRDYSIGSAPVVDDAGECVGVFTQTDVTRHAADGASDQDVDKVSDWMTPSVKWVPIDATVAEVARVLADEGIHRVIVMDERSIRGIVSALDVVRFVARHLPKKAKAPAKKAKKRVVKTHAKTARR